MGSEHYCLRWNNHQSNLLGVFSQLLESESLVDVTLACTEGPSIRAHKVVLSACSSYFQALFLDHPNRHPIVILKDVRFAELRTLVDFMYKGEVNVEYCQLSALLKTAESLKVKGLADMTNINAAAVQQASRDAEHSQASSATTTATATTTTTTTTSTGTSTRQSANDRTHQDEAMAQDGQDERHHGPAHQQQQRAAAVESSSSAKERDGARHSERDRDRRDRDKERGEPPSPPRHQQQHQPILEPKTECIVADEDGEEEDEEEDVDERLARAAAAACHDADDDDDDELDGDVEVGESPATPPPATTTTTTTTAPRRRTSPCPGPLALDRPRSRRDSDSAASLEEARGCSLSPLSARSGPSDMSLSNNNAPGGLVVVGPLGGGVAPVTIPLGGLPQSRLPSPHSTEPLAGPSGLPPVQQVPLSLKKEVDWERSTEDRSISNEISSDYRLPPDPELMGMDERVFACMYCGASFLHQSKLTRHILSHSLESLKYREQTAHLQLQAQLGLEPTGLHLPPEAHYPPGAAIGPLEPMDLELAAVHSDPRTGVVLCKFCGKSFPDVGSLITHLPTHTGDRPFKCEFCGKAFKLRHHMKDHCRVHTGERPFRCSLCGKTFSRSTILKAHEKTHYPKYVRKFLSPSPVDPMADEEAAVAAAAAAAAAVSAAQAAAPHQPNPHAHH